MARIARNGTVMVYPTGWIEVSGRMDNGNELEITLSEAEARILVDTFKYADQMEDGHLGHGHWHARNPEIAFPCETCTMKDDGELELGREEEAGK